MNYQSPFNSLKKFVHMVEYRIPLNVKIVAEIRMIWKDVVGESMAKRSKVVKCEYVPKKDTNGNATGEFHRRLLVYTIDGATQNAMITYTSEYLERVPKRLKIHSFRFQQTKYPLEFIEAPYIPQKPILNVTQEEKEILKKKLEKFAMSEDLSKTMISYLYVWKNQQNKGNK